MTRLARMKPTVALFGANHWGEQLLRILSPLVFSITVIDPNPVVQRMVRKKYPHAHVLPRPGDLWKNPDISAVFIATPSSTHFDIAKQALLQHKHVFVEKPMTQSDSDARELIRLQKKSGTILMVDHTYLYSKALQKAKQMIIAGRIGTVTGIDSLRIGPGIIRRDGSVLWDLAPHDISIGMYLLGSVPTKTHILTGLPHSADPLQQAVLLFEFGSIPMTMTLSWISAAKIRQLMIYGTKGSLSLSWEGPKESLTVYPNMSQDGNPLLHGKPVRVSPGEPLTLAVKNFLTCIKHQTTPETDGVHGRMVVECIEQLERVRAKPYR